MLPISSTRFFAIATSAPIPTFGPNLIPQTTFYSSGLLLPSLAPTQQQTHQHLEHIFETKADQNPNGPRNQTKVATGSATTIASQSHAHTHALRSQLQSSGRLRQPCLHDGVFATPSLFSRSSFTHDQASNQSPVSAHAVDNQLNVCPVCRRRRGDGENQPPGIQMISHLYASRGYERVAPPKVRVTANLSSRQHGVSTNGSFFRDCRVDFFSVFCPPGSSPHSPNLTSRTTL